MDRTERSTKVLQKALRVGLYAGIAVGTILGVPPFMNAIGDLLGGPVTQIYYLVGNSPLLADVIKYLSMAFWGLGGYGIFKSNLDGFKKFVGLGFCSVVLFNLFAISSEDLSTYIIGSLIPLIGSIIWILIQAAQIFMLTLRNNPEAIKKLLSKLQRKTSVESDSEDTPTQAELKSYLGKNKLSEAVTFLMFCGTAGYIVEFVVNVMYSSNSVNWWQILIPGGALSLGWNLISAIVVLLFTIGSIEFFVISLQNLDEVKEAIN